MDISNSGSSSIGGTLTGGVQDIAALLPLLGTEQCEDHIASALTDGYLYAAATPMSIFGSLGVARAGFKTLLSAISIYRLKFDGAKVLADAGFKPQGRNLSLIMLDKDGESYCCETRVKSMMKELHVEDSNRIRIYSKNRAWNIKMILATAISCIVSIAPYVHLNLHDPNKLNHFVRWAFPVIRAIGGFLTATMIQLVIQSRLLMIMRKRLILDGLGKEELKSLDIYEKEPYLALDQRFSILEQAVRRKIEFLAHTSVHTFPDDVNVASPTNQESHDSRHGTQTALHSDYAVVEMDTGSTADGALPQMNHPESRIDKEMTQKEKPEEFQERIMEASGSSLLRWIFLVLLFVGIIASVVGYVGCFSAVQGSGSSKEALIWLCLEAGLSIIRIILWAINPKSDDAPPLVFTLKLDEHAPLPTCNKSVEEIEELKTLPLVRATEFLEAITSYAGVLHRFNHPRFTLYYTLTRRFHAASDPLLKPELSSSERVLCITIFDHTERTTRVYSEGYRKIQDTGNDETGVLSNDKNVATPDLSYFYSADPVTVDLEHGILRTRIGHEIQYKDDPIAGNTTLRMLLAKHYHSILDQVNFRIKSESDALENDWTLNLGEEESRMQKGKAAGMADGDDSDGRARDHKYLEQGRFERKFRDLIPVRGKWVEDYMDWLHNNVSDDLTQLKKVHNIEVGLFELETVELLLIQERVEMEIILAHEVHGWEEKLKEHRMGVLGWLITDGGMDLETRGELEKRGRVELWERLEDGRSAMTARMEGAESTFLQRVTDAGKKGADEGGLKWKWEERTCKTRNDWESLFSEIESTPSPHLSPRHDRLKKTLERYHSNLADGLRYDNVDDPVRRRCRERTRKMYSRLESEIKNVEERLQRGFEHCQEFKTNQHLVNLTHSDSKWLQINIHSCGSAIHHALRRNKHAILVYVYAGFASLSDITQFFTGIRNTRSCTSIRWFGWDSIPASIELPSNILSISLSNGKLSSAQEDTLALNRSQLDKTQRTTVEFSGMGVDSNRHLFSLSGRSSSFTLRFFSPSSYHLTLVLRLIHRSTRIDQFLQVDLHGFRHPIPTSSSFVLEDIPIMPQNVTPSSAFTFKPGSRNTLTFILTDGYHLCDIELLNNDGSPYRPTDAAYLEEVASELVQGRDLEG